MLHFFSSRHWIILITDPVTPASRIQLHTFEPCLFQRQHVQACTYAGTAVVVDLRFFMDVFEGPLQLFRILVRAARVDPLRRYLNTRRTLELERIRGSQLSVSFRHCLLGRHRSATARQRQCAQFPCFLFYQQPPRISVLYIRKPYKSG